MHLQINIDSGVPIYLQIADQIRQIAAAGGLAAGDKLPSVRTLAVKLRVNPNTVQAAYRHLEAEGTVQTRQGLGVFLSDAVKKMPARERTHAVASLLDQVILKAHQLDLDRRHLSRLFNDRLEAFQKRVVSRQGEEGQKK